ncbi:thioredoxin domain-containing protein [Pendulispora rubella]|uniref:Thioredoxin domain-containing protein n=1 Tax=Pendulispora rubella TaxID=2741070 RepID=A0ABZ2L0D7_9BACT
MKAWLGLCAALLLGCGSAPYQTSQPAPAKTDAKKATDVEATSQVSENEGPVPIGPDDPVWGSRWAPVTIVEIGDFQCPFCERAEHTVEQLKADYGKDKLRVVWKNFPLPFHADAQVLAEAGQGVFALGGNAAFWKFHAVAFARMKERNPDVRATSAELSSWAQEAGVDGKKILLGLDKHTWGEKVRRDMDVLAELKVNGTPAFFINGVLISGAQPKESFTRVIDEEMIKAAAQAKAGTVRDRIYLEMTATNRKNAKDADDDEKDDPSADKTIYKVPLGASPILGPANAPVTIVEFSDFECPFCKRAEDTVKTLTEKYPKDVRIVWKNNPLPFHKRAMPAAELAVEAQTQKGVRGFWAAHDKLFEKSPALDEADLLAIAGDVKLDAAKVKTAFSSHRHKVKIEADQFLADDLGATGTPTFFVNGRRVVGAQPIEVFDKVIEQELQRARDLLAKGTAPTKLYEALVKDGKSAPEPERKTVPPAKDAPTRGQAAAKVTIVEFSDFQCPFCQRVNGTIEQLMKEYDGRVKLVFRHLPLPFHPNAHIAAEAATEAYRQKGSAGFFKMHDLLFANQAQLDRDSLQGYAGQVGLDVTKFGQSLDAHTHSADIDADAKVATDSGINGTPSFLINGYYLSGAQPYRSFKRLVERALAETAKPAAGKAR